jgi:hypothetical protein
LDYLRMRGDSPHTPIELEVDVNVPPEALPSTAFVNMKPGSSAEPRKRRDSGREGGSPASAEGAEGDQRSRREAAEKAHDRLVSDLRDIQKQLDDLSQPWQEVAKAVNLPADRLRDVANEISLLKQTADKMLTAETDQSSALALEAVTTASVTEGDLAEMQGAAQSVTTTSGNIVSRTLALARNTLNQAVKWLLNLISHLVTPKEWTLTGGIQMPGLAQATISVTFG